MRKSSDDLASRNDLFMSARRNHTFGIIQQCGENCRSPNALSNEQLGCCADFIEANMEFARKKVWHLLENIYKVKGTHVMACEQFFRSPNRILDMRVSAEEESADLPCFVKGPRDQAQASQLAATMFLHFFDYIRIVKSVGSRLPELLARSARKQETVLIIQCYDVVS